VAGTLAPRRSLRAGIQQPGRPGGQAGVWPDGRRQSRNRRAPADRWGAGRVVRGVPPGRWAVRTAGRVRPAGRWPGADLVRGLAASRGWGPHAAFLAAGCGPRRERDDQHYRRHEHEARPAGQQ